jgi:hypothetical protein
LQEKINDKYTYARPVRLAYQSPTSSTFLSEQTSQQYFSLRTNQHQPSATSHPNRLAVCMFREAACVAVNECPAELQDSDSVRASEK